MLAALCYLLGFAASIVAIMYARHSRTLWPYLVPPGLGCMVVLVLGGLPFDWKMALFMGIGFLVLSVGTVFNEERRGKAKKEHRDEV